MDRKTHYDVIIVGGDISQQEFGVAMADGLLRIPERTTIYVSSADRPLAFVRRLFRRKRIGEMWTEELFKEVYRVMKKNGKLSTYSCARVVRDNMKKAGFIVKDGPIVGRRSPSTIAIK